jgi:hypothetical protein
MEECGQAIVDIRQMFRALDEKIDRRFDSFERRMDRRFDRGERWFMWLLGAQIATLIAMIGGLFQLVTKLI